jgi:hypothetical protein
MDHTIFSQSYNILNAPAGGTLFSCIQNMAGVIFAFIFDP